MPGLIAADVWMALVTTGSVWVWSGRVVRSRLALALVVTGRLRALTMPVVTVPARPSGLPTAMTGSPTARSSESPTAIGVGRWVVGDRDDGEVGRGSVPRISACRCGRRTVVTVSFCRAGTTWLFVSTCPVLSMTTPDPCPPPWLVVAVMLTTLGETRMPWRSSRVRWPLPCMTGAEALLPRWRGRGGGGRGLVSLFPVFAAATVPPEARRAASTATAMSWPTPRLAAWVPAPGAGWPSGLGGPVGEGVAP